MRCTAAGDLAVTRLAARPSPSPGVVEVLPAAFSPLLCYVQLPLSPAPGKQDMWLAWPSPKRTWLGSRPATGPGGVKSTALPTLLSGSLWLPRPAAVGPITTAALLAQPEGPRGQQSLKFLS